MTETTLQEWIADFEALIAESKEYEMDFRRLQIGAKTYFCKLCGSAGNYSLFVAVDDPPKSMRLVHHEWFYEGNRKQLNCTRTIEQALQSQPLVASPLGSILRFHGRRQVRDILLELWQGGVPIEQLLRAYASTSNAAMLRWLERQS